MDTDTVHHEDPATRRGDPFVFAGDHPHACMDGLVFLTYSAFDDAVGEEAEKLEVLPCRRCSEAGRS